jgi:chemotaxis protein MotB
MPNTIKVYRKRKTREKYSAVYNGMWKVAYADFITAMMAFFLLMWLLSITSDETLKGVAKYFTPTASVSDKAGLGDEGGVDANIEDGIGAPHSAANSLIYGSPSRNSRKANMNYKARMIADAEQQQFLAIMSNIQQNPELQDLADNINVSVADEGLKIQIMDSENRPMFKPDTYELQPYMNRILTIVGKMIKNQPNYIAITGHTASFVSKNPKLGSIDAWNISSQRANEVRKFLVTNVIDDYQVVKIVGMADREPLDLHDQYSTKNIRVSITLLSKASLSPFQQSSPLGKPLGNNK